MEFRKYMHIERFGNREVQGIELGTTCIFSKLDGTNASTWLGDDGTIRAGSRTRELGHGADNAGFHQYVLHNPKYENFHGKFPKFILYGEWLVPHTIRAYEDTAWRDFYVFDVWNDTEQKYLPYDEYKPLLEEYGISYIPCVAVIKNGDYEHFLHELRNATFLIKDGKAGEGIVIKNYDYQNGYGRTTWAKIVTNNFKAENAKKFNAPNKTFAEMVEEKIALEFVTEHLVQKTYAKIVNEEGGWHNKCIPRLLQTVFYDLVREDMWEILKKFKNPTINFKTLNTMTILRIKQILPELF